MAVNDELVIESSIGAVEVSEQTVIAETTKAPEQGDYLVSFSTVCFLGSYDIDSSTSKISS